MEKETFVKEFTSYCKNKSDHYDKINIVKYLRNGPCSILGLRGCKELLDKITGGSNNLFTDGHVEVLYSHIEKNVDDYKKGLVKTTEDMKLYSCRMCGGVNGEVIKNCDNGICMGQVIGDVTVVTTIKRYKS